MPLEPYLRGKTYWAKGTIDLHGEPVTEYIRKSTGARTRAGADRWIADQQRAAERRAVLGPEEAAKAGFTFSDAYMLYPVEDKVTSRYMVPLLRELGQIPARDITPQMVVDLGPKLYPDNAVDTWRRWVIAPVRAVINRAHKLGKCPPIRIPGFSKAEQVKQDRKRGKKSRQDKTPGSWDWLLAFRAHASPRHGALAFFMFTTGARVGQSVAMHPDAFNLELGTATIPGAKGHDDRVVQLMPELVETLKKLHPKAPRGWDVKRRENLRMFGFADKDGPRKGWATACKKASIAYLPPHSAGRHGFAQELKVRQKVDGQAIAQVGGWSDTSLIERVYTHGEDSDSKILEALRTGLVQAQNNAMAKTKDVLGKKL